MSEPKLSAKGRRHARNIERSAVRRASAQPCVAGTDKVIKNPGKRWDAIENRVRQQAKIDKKRKQRRDFKALGSMEKGIHREAGRRYMRPGEVVIEKRTVPHGI